jgi:hypothetical protein
LARGYAQIAGKSRKQREKHAKRRGSDEAFQPVAQFRAIYRKKRKKSVKSGVSF